MSYACSTMFQVVRFVVVAKMSQTPNLLTSTCFRKSQTHANALQISVAHVQICVPTVLSCFPNPADKEEATGSL